MNSRRAWSAVAAELFDLVLPARCAGCGARPTGAPLCLTCRSPLRATAKLSWPQPIPPGLPPPWSVTPYAGVVRSAVLAYKEDGRIALGRPLGAALARSLSAAASYAASPVLAVPVPSSASARRARGHDPMRRLALIAVRQARATGCVVRLIPSLRIVTRVADQSALGAEERRRNVNGAHAARHSAVRLVHGQVVVLLDDVVTTGATLAESARALRSAGAVVVAAATIAATARKAG